MNEKFLLPLAIILLLGMALLAGADVPTAEDEFFQFELLPALPVQPDGALVGFVGKDVLSIGGYIGDDGQRRASRYAYVLFEEAEQWLELTPLPDALAEGAVANAADGMICAGGYRGGEPSSKVIRYSVENKRLVSEVMPNLPHPLVGSAAAVVSDQLYVAGSRRDADTGNVANVFLSLDLLVTEPQWQELAVWPGGVMLRPTAAGLHGKFYLFGATAATQEVIAYEFVASAGWRQLPSPPRELTSVLAGPCGDAHILLFDGGTANQDILAYHSVSEAWVKVGVLPETIYPLALAAVGTEFSLIGGEEVIRGKAELAPTGYSWINHVVVVVFMVGMLMIGGYLAKREKNSQDYFRGGKRVPWWAAGLSMFATGASAMSLMAMPGKAFSSNWVFLAMSFYIVVIFLPMSLFVHIPIGRRLNVATANEYLERRYNLFIRLCASIIWSLIQILGRMAAVMLLPAYALSSVAGIPIEISILIMGVITTLYVYLGGLESVIWTDVIQALIMVSAVGICAVWALVSLRTDMAGAWQILQSESKLHMFNWRVDLTTPCVLLMCVNVFASSLGQIGDQNFIQRIQCTKSERDAKKAAITQLAVAVPLNVVLFSMGTILYLFYRERPEMLNPAVKADAVFPLFAAQNLPVGLAGLVMVAILAATMSTLSSALNSVANIGAEDFYRRLSKNATDRKCLILGKVLTACLGAFGTVAALVLANTKLMSVWDLYLTILGILLGAIAGIFALGIFTHRANSGGALIGAIASFAAVLYVKHYTHLHFFSYTIVGVATCVVVGYAVSLLIPLKQKELTGLTVYTILQRRD